MKDNDTKVSVFNVLAIAVLVIVSLFSCFNVCMAIKTLITKRFEIFGTGVFYVAEDDFEPKIHKQTFCFYKTNKPYNAGDIIIFMDEDKLYVQKVKSIDDNKVNVIDSNNIITDINADCIIGTYTRETSFITSYAEFSVSVWGYIFFIGAPIGLIVLNEILIYKKTKKGKTNDISCN